MLPFESSRIETRLVVFVMSSVVRDVLLRMTYIEGEMCAYEHIHNTLRSPYLLVKGPQI